MPRKPASRRVRLSIEQKLEVCEFVKANPGWLLKHYASWATDYFQVPEPLKVSCDAASNILKNQATLQATASKYLTSKKCVPAQVALLDEKIAEWVLDKEECCLAITGEMIKIAGKVIADKLKIPTNLRPTFSNGWLYYFQKRHGFSFRRCYGESASITPVAVQEGRVKMQLLASDYHPSDIFNMGETSFSFRQAPTSTICSKPVAGFKQDKTRMTTCVCANADGSEKVPLLFLGQARVPRDLKNRDVASELGVGYVNSKKGWMTKIRYLEWIEAANALMKSQGCHILLFVDNISSHNEDGRTFSNIQIGKLPPNTTSKLQPMDQGVIKDIKAKFYKKKAIAAIESYNQGIREPYKPDLYTAMRWCNEAWQEVKETTVKNCWRYAEIIKTLVDVVLDRTEYHSAQSYLTPQMSISHILN